MPKKTVVEMVNKMIGCVDRVSEAMWWVDENKECLYGKPQMRFTPLNFVPGLFKIFDDVLMYAVDNHKHDIHQTTVAVTVNTDSGVEVWFDGVGLPTSGVMPEHLFSFASNEDPSEKKHCHLGVLMANIFSKRFEVETYHAPSKSRYCKVWTRNMYDTEPAKMENLGPMDADTAPTLGYIRISFCPDYPKFDKMTGLKKKGLSGGGGEDEDVLRLMKRRVYDIAGTTEGRLRLLWNGERIDINSFREYVGLFPSTFTEGQKANFLRQGVSPLEETDPTSASCSFIHAKDASWEVFAFWSAANTTLSQMSFVNHIATTRGGNHLRHIVDQLTKPAIEEATRREMHGLKPYMIKKYLTVFINCSIDDPLFDSHTKETLVTPTPKFGSRCSLPSEQVVERIQSHQPDLLQKEYNEMLSRQPTIHFRTTRGHQRPCEEVEHPKKTMRSEEATNGIDTASASSSVDWDF